MDGLMLYNCLKIAENGLKCGIKPLLNLVKMRYLTTLKAKHMTLDHVFEFKDHLKWFNTTLPHCRVLKNMVGYERSIEAKNVV